MAELIMSARQPLETNLEQIIIIIIYFLIMKKMYTIEQLK